MYRAQWYHLPNMNRAQGSISITKKERKEGRQEDRQADRKTSRQTGRQEDRRQA